MITEKDLHEAIAECQGERNPNANTCIKLAAFYTILDHITEKEEEVLHGYSYAPEPITSNEVDYDGESDFAIAISGKDAHEVWSLMDELMQTLQITNPPLYNSVMRRIYG